MSIKEKEKQNDLIAVCIIYLIIMLLLIGLRAGSYLGLFSKFSADWQVEVVFTIFTQVGLFLVFPILAFIWYKRRSKQKITEGMSFSSYVEMQSNKSEESVLKSWGFKKLSPKTVLMVFGLGILMFVFNVFVSAVFNVGLSVFGYRHMSGGDPTFLNLGFTGLLIALVMGAVLPGVCEEVTHRGMLLRTFSGRFGALRAVMLSSIMFGLLHMNIVQVFYTAVLGYIMALAILATRSIWTGIILHFVNNALATYPGYAESNGWFMGDMMTYISNFIGNYFFLFILVFYLLYLVIMQIIQYFARENYIKDNLHSEQGAQIPRNLRGRKAINFYLTIGEQKPKSELRPIEKALLYGIIFGGVVITTMTMIWGFL